MLFLSPGFALFLALVFLLYWLGFKKTALTQNLLLLAASLVFYTWYNWKFSLLLIISILFNFYIAKAISRNNGRPTAKGILWAGLVFNLGILIAFKYFGLFTGLTTVFSSSSIQGLPDVAGILLPLGISFYTFQLLGYLIDIYNEEIEESRDLVAFAAYVIYFPKIAAGPIEPAQRMLPLLAQRREFNNDMITDGLRQVLWGLLIKLVIANNCATFTGAVFTNTNAYSGSTLLIGAIFYIFQVYGDFAGYSNMAIGISKLFGLPLSRNFHAPFFALTISEYWRRWHMTLTAWMMKYVFKPLSFLLRSWQKAGLIISVISTFVLVGLWHGSAATFIIFGLLHGLYFIPVILFPGNGQPAVSHFFNWKRIFQRLGLFVLVMLTCIFFGSRTIEQAVIYIQTIFSRSLFSAPVWPPFTGIGKVMVTAAFIIIMLIVEWLQRGETHELQLSRVKPYQRRIIYALILAGILLFGAVSHIKVLYAQF